MKILPFLSDDTCTECGRLLISGNSLMGICDECRNRQNYFDRAASVCEFSGVAKELLHNLKYNEEKDIGIFFGFLMAGKLRKLNWKVDIILPVPLHNDRLLERGYNQSLLLSNEISRECDICINDRVLIRSKATKSQVMLSKAERSVNVHGAFEIINPEKVMGKSILVVDDIMTTGSTLNECSKVLKNSGACRVYCLSAASPINLNNS